MTNREWLNNMSMIDRLNILINATDNCVLYLLGVMPEDTERCERFHLTSKSFDDTCYNCVAAWLNEMKRNNS